MPEHSEHWNEDSKGNRHIIDILALIDEALEEIDSDCGELPPPIKNPGEIGSVALQSHYLDDMELLEQEQQDKWFETHLED